ncbi:hypothetical protein GOP47_0023676 [Adiantum capillus-veneris]|uniref:RNA methyltransferase n=1 Tax=Adiantum capillus-veneris TaxID=13818 RepID=A0A9D4U6H5_ADICA|nr:hypothetical protein GOP47_0023676 [Adiantum capillus-veneris]
MAVAGDTVVLTQNLAHAAMVSLPYASSSAPQPCPTNTKPFFYGEHQLPFASSCFQRSLGKTFEASIQARSVRPVPIRIISVGKNRKDGVDTVIQSYLVKLRRYCKVEDVQIQSNPLRTSDVIAQVEGEGARVLRSISPKDCVVLLDERGEQLTSEQFAALIEEAGSRIPTALVFCIGGPYGHGPDVVQRSNRSVRLSSMVLNHQVALIVLLEQVYRAWTILRGEKYHH